MTTVYEGFIIKDTTPQAFALIESWSAKLNELSSKPDFTINEAVSALQKQMEEMILTIGRMEQAINLNAGKVITA